MPNHIQKLPSFTCEMQVAFHSYAGLFSEVLIDPQGLFRRSVTGNLTTGIEQIGDTILSMTCPCGWAPLLDGCRPAVGGEYRTITAPQKQQRAMLRRQFE